MEEGKLLSEALSTVKIQVQQMKRHLVRQFTSYCSIQCLLHEIEKRRAFTYRIFMLTGTGSAHGCA